MFLDKYLTVTDTISFHKNISLQYLKTGFLMSCFVLIFHKINRLSK